MKAGKEYEKLVEHIYKELYKEAEVKFDDHIPGIFSGIERQIDVSIRFKIGEVEKLIIVQAKDWKDPVNVTVVDAFISVIDDVGADKGILICRSGYSSTAIPYAHRKKIDVLSAHSAIRKKWAMELQIPVIKYEQIFLLNTRITTHFPENRTAKSIKTFPDFRQGGTEADFNKLLIIALNQNEAIRTGQTISLIINTDNLYTNQINGEWHKVKDLILDYKFEKLQVSSMFFNPSEYRALKDHLSARVVASFVVWDEIAPIARNEKNWKILDINNLDFDDTVPHAVINSINFSDRFYDMDLGYLLNKYG